MADMIIDPYTWLDFKPTFGGGTRQNSGLVPSWVGEHHRRLTAYKMLDSYARNAARFWMSGDMDEEELAARREYGDDATLIGQIRTSLLGSDQSIVVGSTDDERANTTAQSQRDRLRRWADKENFDLKVLEIEGTAIRLGDGVMVLGWDPEANRPRLTVWDPGFYFPVLDPRQPTDQYPEKVHIAYEYEELQPDGSKRRYVRRITWELLEEIDDETGEATVYQYPWGESTLACHMSDGTWRIDDIEGEVDTFSMDRVQWELTDDPDNPGEEIALNAVNIGVDFIPVIHIPNMAAGADHFGESAHSAVLQILDDIISTDTDLQAASATTGSPPIAISGGITPKAADGTVTGYGPGMLLETGDGNATMIDTSRSLDALLKYDEHLLSRLSVNARVPESLMGRIKPSEVPSGIALSLSFAPHSAMIGEMRLVRKKKYRLLFRFVNRFFQAFGEDENAIPESEELFDAELVFGTFLPADRKETVDLVVQLLQTSPPAISLATAVRMLVEAGFPIEDAAKEVDAIVQNDFASAAEMLDATADVNAVRKRLGMTPLNPEQLPPEDPESEREPEPVVDPNVPTPPTPET